MHFCYKKLTFFLTFLVQEIILNYKNELFKSSNLPNTSNHFATKENPFQNDENAYSQSNLSKISNNSAIIERPCQVIENVPANNQPTANENFIGKRTIFLLSSFVVALLVLIAGIFIGIFGVFG